MNIKILGKGCKRCDALERRVRRAVDELEEEATFEKVTDINAIADYSVMQTPALVVNEHVKISGRVPSTKKLKKLLSE